jgi:signal transduction histidine kinase
MGNIIYYPENNNIIKIIYDCVNHLKAQAAVKNITIETSTMTECWVRCDLNMVNTITRNLVSNAIKFSFENSVINVDVCEYSADNNYMQISVKDAGTGISKENMNKLFKLDEKINSRGTKNEKGTGLGLILCKEFIDKHNHNCKIWVDSEIDKGTTFFFTLQKAN